jgi:hypothetical protein
MSSWSTTDGHGILPTKCDSSMTSIAPHDAKNLAIDTLDNGRLSNGKPSHDAIASRTLTQEHVVRPSRQR